MDFEKLVKVYEELEKTPSGNKMREILAEFFKTVPKDDIRLVSYLMLGQIASDYESVVLGLAEKSVLKAISVAGGAESLRVKKLMQTSGDVGLVAEEILKKKPMTLIPLGKLTIHELDEKLHKVANLSGSGSADQRTNIIAGMLQKSSSSGAKYLARISLGTLRMGVASKTILDALSIAFTGDKKSKSILETAYNICPDIGIIAETLAKEGIKKVSQVKVKVGRPIQMMLGQRVKSLDEALEKIPGELTVEAKYDGERIQAHRNKEGKVSLFSRRLDNITNQFPDLVEHLNKAIKEKEFILEGEVIAIDKKGEPLPFQILMQRRRKYDVTEYVKKIPIQLKVFDLLYLNGKSWLDEPYYKRSEQLSKIVKKDSEVVLTERILTNKVSDIEEFFQKMLKSGYEGIFIKSRAEDSVYQAGVRGWNWIKWKKEYVKEMVDTLDLVIVGAFYGKGKRSGNYGALLCAAYNPDKDQFETLCKLGTGLTDEVLEELPKKLKKHKIEKKPARLVIKKEMIPDVWFSPFLVVEVFGAEFTKSPYHTCASGLALRFPRFLRFREEKSAEQSTTSEEVEQLYGK
jgi:DNA ligase 1